MPGRLAGKTAIITGSSSGLGRAIALAYADDGANVCCVDLYSEPRNVINPETGKADDFNNRSLKGQVATHEELKQMHGPHHSSFIKADITEADQVERAITECVALFGRLDVMINNAGISVESTHIRALGIHETSEEDWDKTMAINAKGVFLGCKYAIRQMLQQDNLPGEKDRGWIINIASVQGLVGYYGTPSYCASKGAVVQLTKQVALDYAKERIHCNALCPGFLKTTMTRNLQSDPTLLEATNKSHPFGGMGEVGDVARAAVFLASDDARWITGVPLPVDGGYLAL